MFLGLAFLPEHEVMEGWQMIRRELAERYPAADSIALYVGKNYVLPGARYPPKMWVTKDLTYQQLVKKMITMNIENNMPKHAMIKSFCLIVGPVSK